MSERAINKPGDLEPPLLPQSLLVDIISGDKTVRPDPWDRGRWVGLKGGPRSEQEADQGLCALRSSLGQGSVFRTRLGAESTRW